MKLTALLFLTALAGCGPSIKQLKQDISNSACDEELRRFLADRVRKLERTKTLTKRQLIKNLQDIRDDINCD